MERVERAERAEGAERVWACIGALEIYFGERVEWRGCQSNNIRRILTSSAKDPCEQATASGH